MAEYRPWGLLGWLLRKLPSRRWGLLGAISPEKRSLATWEYLKSSGALGNYWFAKIEDPPSRFTQGFSRGIEEREKEFLAKGGINSQIRHFGLFDRTERILSFTSEFLRSAGADLIVDISSLPKRFFFPTIRTLLRDKTAKNLLVTYTVPSSYTHEPLAVDFQSWKHLPLFGEPYPVPPLRVLVVSVGYLVMGLPDVIEHVGPDVKVKLLFPFPPGPPSYQRVWNFVRVVEKNLKPGRVEVIPVHADDMDDAFEHLLALTSNGSEAAALAPFGPKPISLAMCVFATQKEVPVYYTQPRAYHPEYSKGVSVLKNGEPETYAYCLRLNGSDLLSVP